MLYLDPAALAKVTCDLTEGRADCLELAHPAIRDVKSADIFMNLYRAVTAPSGELHAVEAEEGLLQLVSRLIERRHPTRPSAPKSLEKARACIDDDPSEPLTLGDLAAIGGVSQFQLVRGFSKAYGLTPHAYLVQRRLQKARQMIAKGTSLAETASAAGFSDQSHLTRLFVRTYGMSPGIFAAAMT